MKILSRKAVVVLIIIATVLLVSSLALAAVGNIANTKHNFTASAPNGGQFVDSGNVQPQVCIYCHTPHNAGQARLLWNKSNKSGLTYKFYSSGSTTKAARQQASFTADSPSLLCLGCHDGKSAMNVLHNGGKGTGTPPTGVNGYPAGSEYAFGSSEIIMENPIWNFGNPIPIPMIGGSLGATAVDLTDDHPVGFSYKDVFTERTAGLHSPDSAVAISGNNIRLFGTNQKVECSTCHDPHVDYNTTPALKPFLVMSNSGSALCLSCHDK